MKKIMICLLSLLLFTGTITAHTPLKDVDSLVNNIKLEVKHIDSQVLYKVRLDLDGYKPGDHEEYYEWLFELYFDAGGVLRKLNTIYFLDYAESVTYFDTGGVAIFTSYYSDSMLGLFSVERYLDKEGDLLYVDHVSRDDYTLPSLVELIVDERIIRRAGPRAEVPTAHNNTYDNVLCVSDFGPMFLSKFDSEGMKFGGSLPAPPAEMKRPVRFTRPVRGDTTSLIRNGVEVYKKPTRESLVLFTLDIRRDIEILDVKGDWCKISKTTYGGETLEGYIQMEDLAPVERPAD